MHILILGAAGMVGRKLTDRLLRDGRLGKHDITRMTLQDVVAPRIRMCKTRLLYCSFYSDTGRRAHSFTAPVIADT